MLARRLAVLLLLASGAMASGAIAQDLPGLGFAFRPAADGLLVQALADDGPASGAGLLEGDLVTAVAGMKMPGLAPEAIAEWMRTVGGASIPILLDVTRTDGLTQIAIVPAPYSREKLSEKVAALPAASIPPLNFSDLYDLLPPEAASDDCDEVVPLTSALSTEAVRCALASGADPNAKDASGWAPLHTAINRSDTAAIELLVASGARLSVTGPNDRPILHHAVVYAQASPEAIGLLVRLGADLTATDDSGNTPLHAAARFDATESARALLRAGANPNALTPDEYAQTPMHAAFLGSAEGAVVPILLSYGADPTIRDVYDRTPLDIALAAADSEYTSFGAAIEALRAALAE